MTRRKLRSFRFEKMEPRTLLTGTPLVNDPDTLLLLPLDNSTTGAAGETPIASSGLSYETGLVGQALHTNTSGYVRYSNTNNVAAAQGTIEFWIKPSWNATPGMNYTFFEVGDNFNRGTLLSLDGATNLRFIQWGDDPSTPTVEAYVERGIGASGASWAAGVWHHFAATWNGTTHHMELFLDGQSVGSINNGVTISSFSTTYFNLGSETNNLTSANATFDEFRISNRERSAIEILDDYRAGLGLGYLLNTPGGVAADSNGRTIVAETGGHRVAIYSASGQLLFKFGGFGSGNGQFNSPADVDVDAANNIYVVDRDNHRVQKFDSDGNYLSQFGSAGTAVGQFNAPRGLYLDKLTGKIYVADTGNHRVARFNSNGTPDTAWGGSGVVGTTAVVKRDHTGFDRPSDVAINPVTGQVFVADYGNARLEVFNATGGYVRTYLAVYRANGLAFDASGNLYIAGEDPNNGYMANDGRLRLLRAGDELIGKHYTGGLDDIGRIEGGVAVRNDGRIIFTDQVNGRLVATDADFSVPASDLRIDAKGSQVTFRWKSQLTGPSTVRFGTSPTLGSELTDSTNTTNHVLTLPGLTPNSRLYYSASYTDPFDGAQKFTPVDVINTGVAVGHQFLRLKAVGVIYTDANPGAGYTLRSDLADAQSRFNRLAEFYWRNSGFKLLPDITIVNINKDITSGYDLFANMQTDLAAAGYSAANDFDAAWGSCVMCPGNYGGGNSLFGRFVGMCEFVTQDDFVAIHEVNHTLDSIYHSLGLPKYEFNHGIWAVPNGVGSDFSINGQILRNMLPANLTAVSAPFTKIMVAPDADADGVPDSSPSGLTNSLPVTEATLGSSSTLADSDGDGLSDLREATALPYHHTNLNAIDSDSDGISDAVDLNPGYDMNDHVITGSPLVDGVISLSEGWTTLTNNWGFTNSALVSDNNLYQSQVNTYAAWDANFLYLAYKGPSAVTRVKLDGSADNWFMGPDNYDLNLNSGSFSRTVQINVGVPDIFRQIDDDGQFSEFFDTNPQFTQAYQGRTIYNNPGDGLGFSGRLVTESDLQYQRGGSGANTIWEVAIPWSHTTLLQGGHGKQMALEISVAGDKLFETDHAARIELVDPLQFHPGDFDGNGNVDGADFVTWQTNFPKSSGATRSQGDADGDGDVDGADFVVWQTNFPYTPSAGVAEPSSGAGGGGSPASGESSSAAAAPTVSGSAAALLSPISSSSPLTGETQGEGDGSENEHGTVMPSANSVGVSSKNGKSSSLRHLTPVLRDEGRGRKSGTTEFANDVTLSNFTMAKPTRTAAAVDSFAPPKHEILSPAAVDYWIQASPMYRSRSIGRVANWTDTDLFEDLR